MMPGNQEFFKLPLILPLFPGKEIGNVRLLQKYVAEILFIVQDLADRLNAPPGPAVRSADSLFR